MMEFRLIQSELWRKIIIVGAVLAFVFTAKMIYAADAPLKVTLQATLSNSAGPIQGTKRVTVKLYSNTQSQAWQEVHKTVEFRDGMFMVILGDKTPLTPAVLNVSTPNFHLVVEGEETVVTINAVPYAIKAQFAEKIPQAISVTSITASGNLLLTNPSANTQLKVDGTAIISKSMAVGTSALNPNYALNVVGTLNATNLLVNGTVLQTPQNNSILQDLVSMSRAKGNFIVGNGTNFVATANAAARTLIGLGTTATPTFNQLYIGNNALRVSGGRIGIQTSTPQGLLQIGNQFLVSSNAIGLFNTSPKGMLQVANTFIVSGNRVGIGTINPSKTLHIAGDLQVDGIINNSALSNTPWVSDPTNINNITKSNGNVGIGVGSPQADLHVKTHEFSSFDTSFNLNDNTATSMNTLFVRQNRVGIQTTNLDVNSPYLHIAIPAPRKAVVDYFRIEDPSKIHFTVDRSGNTGVGTAFPAGKFDVVTGNFHPLTVVNKSVGFGTTTPNGAIDVYSGGQSTFMVDKKRVGIGLSAPAAKLDIKASSNISTDLGLRVLNSSGTSLFSVANDGLVSVTTVNATGRVRGTILALQTAGNTWNSAGLTVPTINATGLNFALANNSWDKTGNLRTSGTGTIGGNLTVNGSGNHVFQGTVDFNNVEAFNLVGDITESGARKIKATTVEVKTLTSAVGTPVTINRNLNVTGNTTISGSLTVLGQFIQSAGTSQQFDSLVVLKDITSNRNSFLATAAGGRLEVGTIPAGFPKAKLEVSASSNAAADFALRVRDSGASTLLTVANNGQIKMPAPLLNGSLYVLDITGSSNVSGRLRAGSVSSVGDVVVGGKLSSVGDLIVGGKLNVTGIAAHTISGTSLTVPALTLRGAVSGPTQNVTIGILNATTANITNLSAVSLFGDITGATRKITIKTLDVGNITSTLGAVTVNQLLKVAGNMTLGGNLTIAGQIFQSGSANGFTDLNINNDLNVTGNAFIAKNAGSGLVSIGRVQTNPIAPQARLDVIATSSVLGTALAVRNQTGGNLLRVLNNGQVRLETAPASTGQVSLDVAGTANIQGRINGINILNGAMTNVASFALRTPASNTWLSNGNLTATSLGLVVPGSTWNNTGLNVVTVNMTGDLTATNRKLTAKTLDINTITGASTGVTVNRLLKVTGNMTIGGNLTIAGQIFQSGSANGFTDLNITNTLAVTGNTFLAKGTDKLVGIGLTTPVARLEVRATSNTIGTALRVSNSGGELFRVSNSGPVFIATTLNVTNGIVGRTINTINGINISGGAVTLNRLALVQAGNVWDTNGNLTATGKLTVTGTGTTDHVITGRFLTVPALRVISPSDQWDAANLAFSGLLTGKAITGTNLFRSHLRVSGNMTVNSTVSANAISTFNLLGTIKGLGKTIQIGTLDVSKITNSIAGKSVTVNRNLDVTGNLRVGGTIFGAFNFGSSLSLSNLFLSNNLAVTGDVNVTGNATIARISSKKVGIGLTNPSAKFEIKASSNLLADTAFSIRNQTGASLMRVANDGQVFVTGNLRVKNTGGSILRLEGTDHGYIEWYPDGAAAGRKAWTGFGGASDNNFQITNQISGAHIVLFPTVTGNVGIGTAVPGSKLSVAGDVSANSLTLFGGSQFIKALTSLAVNVGGLDRLNIANNGNVGIGTGAPAALLDVNGAGKFAGIVTVTTLNVKTITSPLVTTPVTINRTLRVTGDVIVGKPTIANGAAGKSNLYIDGNIIATKIFGQLNQTASNIILGNLFVTNNATITGNMTVTGNVILARVSSKKVGIGITNPSAKFEIKASSNAAADSALRVVDSAGSSLLRVANNGNVGVGTSAAGSKLDVIGTANVASLRIGKTSSILNSFGDWVGIDFLGTNEVGQSVTLFSAASARISSPLEGSDNPYGLQFWTKTAGGTLTEKMRIRNDGNVGIGTTLPTSKLSVLGDVRVTGNIKVSGGGILEFGVGVVPVKEANAGKIGYQLFTSDALDIIGAGTLGSIRKIKFWNEGGAVFAGSVGIGLASPLARLDIQATHNTVGTALRVINASGTHLFRVLNTGVVRVEGTVSANNIATFNMAGNIQGATKTITIGKIFSGTGGNALVVSGNNVGIGTSPTPGDGYKLRVDGNIFVNGSITGSLVANAAWPFAANASDIYTNSRQVGFGVASPLARIDVIASSNTATQTALRIMPSSGSTALFRVQNDGNVGIGINTPAAKLDIAGTPGAINLKVNGPINVADAFGGVWFGSNLTTTGKYVGAENNSTIIGFYNNGWRVGVKSDGNVGIGTIVPEARLDIVGRGTGGADVRSVAIRIATGNIIEFGAGVSGGKETNAGKIGYKAFSSDALDIVGASTGTDGATRRIKFWNEGGAVFTGGSLFNGKVDIQFAADVSNPNLGLSIQNTNADKNTDAAITLMNDSPGGGTNPAKVIIKSVRTAQGAPTPTSDMVVVIKDGASNLRERFRITSYGNVGIGTSNPVASLDVKGAIKIGSNNNTGGSVGMLRYNATAPGTLELYNNSGWASVASSGAPWSITGSNIYPSTLGNNVGINTTTPAAKLEIDGSTGGSADYDQHLRLKNTTTNKNAGIYFAGRDRHWALLAFNSGNAATDRFSLYDNTANQYRWVVDSAGNVGIGLNNPVASLDVKGAIKVGTNGDANSTGTKGMIRYKGDSDVLQVYDGSWKSLLTTGGTATGWNSSGTSVSTNASITKVGIGIPGVAGFPLSFADSVGDKISLWGQSGSHYGFGVQSSLLQIHSDSIGTDIAFGYGASAAFTESMRIKGNGNVGIGTVAPVKRLQVGDLSANGEGMIRLASLGSGGSRIWDIGVPQGASATTKNYSFVIEDVTLAKGPQFIVKWGTEQVGIGTVTPQNRLDVTGNMVIGGGYAGAKTAPVNGLLVQGNVGIGTATPESLLHVNGNISVSSNSKVIFGTAAGGSGEYIRNSSLDAATNFGIAFYGTGVERMRIQNGGNVGINTAAPSSLLDVNGTARFVGVVTVTTLNVKTITSPSPAIPVTINRTLRVTGDVRVAGNLFATKIFGELNQTAGNLSVNNIFVANNVAVTGDVGVTGNLTLARISHKKVGVGTVNPGAKFEIKASSNATADSAFSILNSSGTSLLRVMNDGKMEIQNGANSVGSGGSAIALGFQSGGYRHWIRSRHNSVLGSGNAIDFYVNNATTSVGSTAPGTNSTPNLTLDSGRVGIGTTGPVARLEIVGTGNVANGTALRLADSTNATLLRVANDGKVGIGTAAPESLLHVNGDISVSANSKVIFGTAAGGSGEYIRNSQSGGSNFGLAFYGLGAERMRIQSGGNVGIGITNPQKLLSVNGDVSANNLFLAGTSPAINVGGANRLTFTSGGLIGVGIATPLAKLDIQATHNSVGTALRVLNSAGSAPLFRVLNDGTVRVEGALIAGTITGTLTQAIDSLLVTNALVTKNLTVSGNSIFAQTTFKRVGIGLTNPAAKLDILTSSNALADLGLRIRNQAGTSLLSVANNGLVLIPTLNATRIISSIVSANSIATFNMLGNISGVTKKITIGSLFATTVSANSIATFNLIGNISGLTKKITIGNLFATLVSANSIATFNMAGNISGPTKKITVLAIDATTLNATNGIKVGGAAGASGSIRYNAGSFEWNNGTTWKTFTDGSVAAGWTEDIPNNRTTVARLVGVGIAAPTARLDVQATHNAIGTAFRVVKSDGVSPVFRVFNNGLVSVSTTLNVTTVNATFVKGTSAFFRSAGQSGSFDPQYALHVIGSSNFDGTVYSFGSFQFSDLRLKKEVQVLDSALTKILKLRGVSYVWNQEAFPNRHFPEGRQIGVIAQEMEEVFPELVNTDKNGFKSVAYAQMAPILIEAIKEQQGQIEELKSENQKLREQMDWVLKKLEAH